MCRLRRGGGGRVDMARGRSSKRKPPARSAHPPAASGAVGTPAPVAPRALSQLGGVEERCICCGEVHVDKFDTSLMCSLGHMTCFPCVSVNVQPHPICSAHCNGFKYRCAECGTWSCVSKTQELAMLCGRHSIALDRLRKQRILRDDFERPRICTCRDTASEPDTPSSEGSGDDADDADGADDADARKRAHVKVGHDAAAADVAQLPRVCRIDWSHGHAQRAKRLERLRTSLLGCNRVVRG